MSSRYKSNSDSGRIWGSAVNGDYAIAVTLYYFLVYNTVTSVFTANTINGIYGFGLGVDSTGR